MSSSADDGCRHTECRYHLEHRGHSEHRVKPTRDCSLTFANEGAHTLEEIAEAIGVSIERVRQIEDRALRKLRLSKTLKRNYNE